MDDGIDGFNLGYSWRPDGLQLIRQHRVLWRGHVCFSHRSNIFFYEGGVGEYTSAMGSIKPEFTDAEYFYGLFFGIIVAALVALAMSMILSTFMFGLRGPYFAIGSLGIAVASAELTITIDYVGGASGISMPLFPGDIEFRSTFFYILCFVLTVISHFLLRWMYSTQFGLAINAIRDDEDKAEAMGIPTLVYKRIGWGVAAAFMGAIGAVAGNMAGFIDKEVAYPIPTFGIFMVAMVCLVAKAPYGGQSLALSFSMWLKRRHGLTAEFTMDCTWSDPDCEYRIFPAGPYGLASDQISRNVWHCC